MKKEERKRQNILFHEHHIKIMRFLLDEFNKKNNEQNKHSFNRIAKEMNKEPTETKKWLRDLEKYGLINIKEKKTNGKTKRYFVHITKDDSSFIEVLLDIFEKFCK